MRLFDLHPVSSRARTPRSDSAMGRPGTLHALKSFCHIDQSLGVRLVRKWGVKMDDDKES
jgi:hypothetical protein